MPNLSIVAVRRPLWLPGKNSGIFPAIKSGDWSLGSWTCKARKYAVRVDMDRFLKSDDSSFRVGDVTVRLDYPFGSIMDYSLEILEEGQYDEPTLWIRDWIEVLACRED